MSDDPTKRRWFQFESLHFQIRKDYANAPHAIDRIALVVAAIGYVLFLPLTVFVGWPVGISAVVVGLVAWTLHVMFWKSND